MRGSVVWNLIPNTANDSCVMSGGCGGEAKNPTKTFYIIHLHKRFLTMSC